MILYSLPHSSYGAKVSIVIAVKGIEGEIEVLPPPGGLRSAQYRALVPTGQIPAIVDGELVISESEVIAEYLNEIYPEPALLPEDPGQRARARFFSRFHDLHLEPPVRNLFWEVPERVRDQDVVKANVERINHLLSRFEALAEPKPYLAGEHLSLADCAFPSTLMYLDLMTGAMGLPVDYPDRIAAWRDTVSRHPGVAKAMGGNRRAGEAWLEGKLRE